MVWAALIVGHGGVTRWRDAATPSVPTGALRVATWNLRNFPGPDHDPDALRTTIVGLRADVIALQEIRDPDALAALLPGHHVVSSAGGGRHGQRVALAVDRRRARIVGPVTELPAVSLGGRVRPALHAYVRGTGGPDAHVVVVHLKAKPEGATMRRRQWDALRQDVFAVTRTGPGHGDTDLVILGDFNPTGVPPRSAHRERAALRRAWAPDGLTLHPGVGGCTAFWQGVRHDAWLEPSTLDLVWSRGFERAAAWPQGICAHVGCRPIRSPAHDPDPWLHRQSDHCPVVVDLRPTMAKPRTRNQRL